MKIEWSVYALADLNRFKVFLEKHHPQLAAIVADEIITKVQVLSQIPKLGRPIFDRSYRQLVLRVVNAPYVVQYQLDDERVFILRVFHGREARE